MENVDLSKYSSETQVIKTLMKLRLFIEKYEEWGRPVVCDRLVQAKILKLALCVCLCIPSYIIATEHINKEQKYLEGMNEEHRGPQEWNSLQWSVYISKISLGK